MYSSCEMGQMQSFFKDFFKIYYHSHSLMLSSSKLKPSQLWGFLKHSVHRPPPPPPLSAGGGWTSHQIFKMGGGEGLTGPQLWERGCWKGLLGVPFFKGGFNFYKKNQLKSEIFKNKKKYFCVITKNSNWEILTTNLVTFKR